MKSDRQGRCPRADEVAVTGLGAVSSLGNSVEEIGRRLASGKTGRGETPDLDPRAFGCAAAPVTAPPAFKTDIHPRLARTMGKHLSLLLASTEQALSRAAISSGMFDPEDIGFFVGMGTVDYHLEDLVPAVLKSIGEDGSLDYDKFFSKGYQEIYPLWSLGMLNNVAFCQAAIHFGIRGENAVFSSHGDAGLRALAEAVRVVSEGKAKVVVAGGVSEEISPLSLARARLKGLTARPDAPGAFLGEAGAAVVLEPLSSAAERGASIFGVIKGFGFSCERDGNFASAAAIARAMEQAVSNAGIGPAEVSVVLRASRDRNETEALGKVFGECAGPPALICPAELLGETFAAGPILNAAVALGVPELTPPGGRGGRSPERFLVNAVSYEGMCASMIIEKTAGEKL